MYPVTFRSKKLKKKQKLRFIINVTQVSLSPRHWPKVSSGAANEQIQNRNKMYASS